MIEEDKIIIGKLTVADIAEVITGLITVGITLALLLLFA